MFRSASLATAAICSVGLLASVATADSVARFDFETPASGSGSGGNIEGFTSANLNSTGLTQGFDDDGRGVLQGQAGGGSNDPQLFNDFDEPIGAFPNNELAAAPGSVFSRVVFSVREVTSAGVVTTFDDTGLFLDIGNGNNVNGNNTVDVFEQIGTDGEYLIVSVDIGTLGVTNIPQIRLDPVGGPGASNTSFQIDFIEFFDTSVVPEPLTAGAVGLLGLLGLKRRRFGVL